MTPSALPISPKTLARFARRAGRDAPVVACCAEAQSLARRETRAEPNRGDWWLYLAQASAGLKDPLTQHQAMAEKLALDGAWPSAIRQLKEARDVKTASFYDLSTISARLRDFEARYKEEREDEKNS